MLPKNQNLECPSYIINPKADLLTIHEAAKDRLNKALGLANLMLAEGGGFSGSIIYECHAILIDLIEQAKELFSAADILRYAPCN